MQLINRVVSVLLFLFICGVTFSRLSIAIPVQHVSSHNNLSLPYNIATNYNRPRPRTEKNRKNKSGSGRHLRENVAKHLTKEIENKYTWRKSEIKSITKEVKEYRGSSSNNKILKEGLVAHEGGKHRGHTILNHVSVAEKTLLKRADFLKTDKKTAGLDHTNIKKPALSSFKSLPKAEKFIDKTLKDVRIRTKLNSWLKNKKSKEVTLELKDLGDFTGIAIDPITRKSVEVRGVTIKLRRDDSNNRGWSIYTAYPSR